MLSRDPIPKTLTLPKHTGSISQFHSELHQSTASPTIFRYLISQSQTAMYSQSSSFLGGANSARPGPQGFGQQPSYLQPGQGQPNPLQNQQTGFPGGQFQPQPTGFQLGQQQQPQPTGYPGQNQQSFLQPNQQQQQNLLPQPTQQTPQRTGLTSSQIANSFAPIPAAPPTPTKPAATGGAKIPKIRLSFLTASDQAKFEQLFKSAAGDNQALDGKMGSVRRTTGLNML